MQDTITFIDATERLLNYVDTRTWTFTTATTKAVQNLIGPTYMVPARPVRIYWSRGVGVGLQITEQVTAVSLRSIGLIPQ